MNDARIGPINIGTSWLVRISARQNVCNRSTQYQLKVDTMYGFKKNDVLRR